MKKILNAKISPAVIIGSALFWFILVVIIYAILMIYWINKWFYTDHVIKVEDVVVTGTGHKIAALIWRKKISRS